MEGSIRLWSQINQLSKEDIVSSLYGITPTEAKAYFALLSSNLHVKDLASEIGRDRTTAQRTFKNLVDKGLANRVRISKPGGGIKYAYQAITFSQLKSEMIKKLDAQHQVTREKITDL